MKLFGCPKEPTFYLYTQSLHLTIFGEEAAARTSFSFHWGPLQKEEAKRMFFQPTILIPATKPPKGLAVSILWKPGGGGPCTFNRCDFWIGVLNKSHRYCDFWVGVLKKSHRYCDFLVWRKKKSHTCCDFLDPTREKSHRSEKRRLTLLVLTSRDYHLHRFFPRRGTQKTTAPA